MIVNRTESYTFDLVDQITGVNYGGGLTAGYEYDPVGNRTSVTGTVPGTGAYTAYHLNQYTSAQGKVNLHDARGNLTTVGTERAFHYDSKDRPVLITALAFSDVLLTLDREDFVGVLGKACCGLAILTPADFFKRERAAGRLSD